MPIRIEVKVPKMDPVSHDFETVPRIGEKIELGNKRWQVTDVVHYASGSQFQVGIIVTQIA